METTILEPTLINAEGRNNSDADLAWAYMLKGDYVNANGYILTLAKYPKYETLAKLMRISLAIAQYTGGDYFKYYEDDYNYVNTIANDANNTYAPLAQAMLKNYDGTTYATLQLLPTEQTTARIAKRSQEDSIAVSVQIEMNNVEHKTVLYPNPTHDKVTVYCGIEDMQQAYITLTNIFGQQVLYKEIKELKTTLNTELLPQGIYMVNLYNKGSTVYTNKLTIIH